MDLNALLRRGLDSHKTGDLAAAESDYREILAAMPGHPKVTYLLGALKDAQGQHPEALALLEEARARLPDEPPCCCTWATPCRTATL